MPGLLMFYVGGTAPGANIELHDVQFAAADRPEEAYPLLREKWFGDKRKVHVDGYARIDWADGYDVSLEPAPFAGEEKLFFVNVGGYRSDELAELHQFGLFVARSADEAKEKAKRALLTDSAQQHKDDLAEVDDCLLLQALQGYHVHLRANPHGEPARPLWQGYLPIGEPAL
ncbi:DUF1543 domain-containing protein [Serratia marcescens]|uniref:DUF1543 domain-containing protein n=1 Tax=Serratia TaxID=613 RepID=UPI0021A8DF1D|nr:MULTISPECIES: DUF1543 domain-containing protein [Serratia]MCT2271122.1 DUF1543 domain-containing protein [Serratia ureilytica]MDP8755620.1 DUF1543 domain-containing protein [Serratia marcescens]MDP8760281.1 DUF1543 domain-containing protein [Serratia marcescens]MDP8770022.1 DUF1543 domain-containing protein [Serratia marcescens]MDP8880126.1 DUF1543 domain-containing protein [Serratia marcescens]